MGVWSLRVERCGNWRVDTGLRVGYDVDMTVSGQDTSDSATNGVGTLVVPTSRSTELATATIDVTVSIPTDTAVALKHATGGKLDIAAAASLVLQLYSTAPLDRSAKTLTSTQHAAICEALGVSPQTTDELVGAIVELTRISFGGLRVKFTAEQVATINGRNVMGLPAKQYAQELIESWYEAWRNGVIG